MPPGPSLSSIVTVSSGGIKPLLFFFFFKLRVKSWVDFKEATLSSVLLSTPASWPHRCLQRPQVQPSCESWRAGCGLRHREETRLLAGQEQVAYGITSFLLFFLVCFFFLTWMDAFSMFFFSIYFFLRGVSLFLLGCNLWRRRLHQDGSKQAQPVWHRSLRFLPRHVICPIFECTFLKMFGYFLNKCFMLLDESSQSSRSW